MTTTPPSDPAAIPDTGRVTIRTEQLVKEYGRTRVVDGVSLEVNTGEVVGLLGPNGAGKTTTFKMMVGFERPTAGKVFFADQDVTMLPIHERARLGIGYLAQQTSVFRKMTVSENLRAVLEMNGYSRAACRDRIEELEEQLSISYLHDRVAERLSGGEMRRVEIARALTIRPKFIFLDEPFAGIDPKNLEDLLGIIQQLRDNGLGVLITDHNVRETLHITDRSYILIKGVITVSGTVVEITRNEQIREQYITERIARDIESSLSRRDEVGKTS